MSKKYRVAIIGTGRPIGTEGATGYGMAHEHARAYQKLGNVEMVACADIRPALAERFACEYDIPRFYKDYHEMLAKEQPDIVSIAVWPHLHAPITLDVLKSGVKAVHCEKPMAATWGEANAMHRTAVDNGVQLTFNHQRRWLEPFQITKKLLDEGAIGKLVRMEAECGDMYDWGTHWLDMQFFFNNESPAKWVIGQIDSRKDHIVFGMPMENQGTCYYESENGVRGLLLTGFKSEKGCAHRLMGTEGDIEIRWDKPCVNVRAKGDADWRPIDSAEGLHDGVAIDRTIANLVNCLETGERPLQSSYNAIQHTEVIFATYESSRRRARVDLPLDVDDSAFLSMLDARMIGPKRW